MNKDITEIVIKVNNREEYDNLYRIIYFSVFKYFNYLERIERYPNYIFINFYTFNSVFFSNQDNMLNDDEVLSFIKERRDYTYSKIYNMNNLNQILYILKNKTISPTYKPKGKIIRTFEDFNNNF